MFPVLQFNTLADLIAYINNEWIPNGNGDITGVIGNSVVNGLAKFVAQSPLNWAQATIVSAGGAVVTPTLSVPGPVIVFTTTTPTSLAFGNNVYNQWLFVNMTSGTIPLSGSQAYFDIFGNVQTTIGPYQIVNLFQAKNSEWFQFNNPVSNTSTIPPLVAGKALFNDGTKLLWADTYIKIPVASFTLPSQYTNANLDGLFYDIFCGDVSRFLLGPDDPNPEWSYQDQTGFNILNGMNLQSLSYPLYLYRK